jgi:hypothetical protein
MNDPARLKALEPELTAFVVKKTLRLKSFYGKRQFIMKNGIKSRDNASDGRKKRWRMGK